LDNATHTLVGVLLGEAAAQVARPGRSGLPVDTRRDLFITLAAIGSNLPDADLVLTSFGGDRLDYLLEHRGYTHTLVGALACALVLLAACAAWLRWRRLAPASVDWAWLAGLALLGPLLHLAMDFSNSYGVHPFWPFFNGWFYGDSVFIVEPLLWACAAPLVFILRTPLARVLVAVLLAVGLLVPFNLGLAGAGATLILALLTAAMLALGRLWRPPPAIAASILMWVLVTATFVGAGQLATARVEALASASFPGAATLDRVLTPTLGNPLCWDLLLVQLEGERYAVRRGTIALAPAALPLERCRARGPDRVANVPLEPVPAAGASFLRWHGQFSMPRQVLAQLAATDCEAAAFLKFARAPWATRRAAQWLIGDLRFDGGPRPGFADLTVTGTARGCTGHTAPWLPPRHELLD